jgi:hypothetical protein
LVTTTVALLLALRITEALQLAALQLAALPLLPEMQGSSAEAS